MRPAEQGQFLGDERLSTDRHAIDPVVGEQRCGRVVERGGIRFDGELRALVAEG